MHQSRFPNVHLARVPYCNQLECDCGKQDSPRKLREACDEFADSPRLERRALLLTINEHPYHNPLTPRAGRLYNDPKPLGQFFYCAETGCRWSPFRNPCVESAFQNPNVGYSHLPQCVRNARTGKLVFR